MQVGHEVAEGPAVDKDKVKFASVLAYSARTTALFPIRPLFFDVHAAPLAIEASRSSFVPKICRLAEPGMEQIFNRERRRHLENAGTADVVSGRLLVLADLMAPPPNLPTPPRMRPPR
jgi:hypothetical protein